MPAPVVVASVPATHPYVTHLSPTPGSASVGSVRRLPDPHPDHPDRDDLVADGRWWPPVMLRPDWLARADYDLLHLHFGYDDQTPARLERMLGVLADRGRPLVLTVHDLRNPHHRDPARTEAQLDVLVPGAAALVTLTSWAADRIEHRWGRRPEIVPHPHVVDLTTMARLRAARRCAARNRFRVGVACKSLRNNSDPMAVLPTIHRTLRELPGSELEVTIHREIWDAPAGRAVELVDWLVGISDEPGVDVIVHERLTDQQLWARLARLEAAVLPYTFGTHSGWLEACHDVGTRVLAPAVGAYAEQGADHVYSRRTLPAVLHAAHAAWSSGALLAGSTPDERRVERERIANAHLRIYRRVQSRMPDRALVGATG